MALALTLYDVRNQMTSVVYRRYDMRGSLEHCGTKLTAVDSLERALERGSPMMVVP